MEEKIEQVARMCHQMNKAFCEETGDNSQVNWGDAPDWQKQSAINGVKAHIASDFTMTPEGSHESWMKEKVDDGWVYGETKDVEKKTHPCIRPYAELPVSQRTKDYIFRAVVHAAYGK